MSSWQQQYMHILKDELENRQNLNPSFSLRAMAKFLNTSPTSLSQVLNGKRPLTKIKAIAFASKLKLTDNKLSQFMEAISKDEYFRLNETLKKERQLNQDLDYQRLQLDQFAMMGEWYYLGILNLTLLDDFHSDLAWMKKRLGITQKECQEAIACLLRLELLYIENGEYFRTSKSLQVSSEIPSSIIRKFHIQNIERAKKSIEAVNIQDRDISSIMMPVDKKRLEEAKIMIQNFRKELGHFLKSGEKSDQIYSLNIQLFPQTLDLE